MAITLRRAEPSDAASCGEILYRAFKTLADSHNFPPDFPSVEVGREVAVLLLGSSGFYGLVAESDGRIVGSNFADHRAPVVGIGPISVDPATQNSGVGRALMQAMLDHFTAHDAPGIRLLQAAYHNRSLCLYTSLGFQTREPVSLLQGLPIAVSFPGHDVRPATEADIPACNELALRVHGFARGVDLAQSVAAGTASVVEHLGHITGYASEIGFRGHAVAETNQALKALIGGAPAVRGPGFLLPTRNHEVLAWCLAHRLRLVMQMNLMTIGLYNEPRGAWLPSILL